MRTVTLVPVEEYLAAGYRPDREYLEGTILERNVGEWDHSRLQALMSVYLHTREEQWKIRVVPEQRVQVQRDRFRVPDVCAVSASAGIEQILTRPPLLCIEILSPRDTMSEMQERIDDYLSFGVPSVWLLDPGKRRGWICTPGEMLEATGGTLRAAGSDIVVPMAGLFE
ncbi:MAG: Uma2 family endonuclease [Bryobacteraceae bacterium]